MPLDEARKTVMGMLAGRVVGIDPAQQHQLIEQAAIELASGVVPTRPPVRYARVTVLGTGKPAAGAKPAQRQAPRRTTKATTRRERRPGWHLGPTAAERAAMPVRYDVTFSSDRSQTHVKINERAARWLAYFTSRRGCHTEEGGVAIARRTAPSRYEIVAVGGPGERSRRKAGSYAPDHAHDAQTIRELEARFGGRYCGIWHSHGRGTNLTPSDSDLQLFASDLSLLPPEQPHVGLIVGLGRHGLRVAAYTSEARGSVDRWVHCQPVAGLEIEGRSSSWEGS